MTGSGIDWGALIAYAGLALLVMAGFWTILPRIYGTTGEMTRSHLIRRALELAELQPGTKMYDLGAGMGRAAILAAREFGARAVAIEVEPVHCLVAWLWTLFSGVLFRVSIRRGNLFDADWGDADVIFVHLSPVLIARLRPQLKRALQAGARVVSVYFPIEGWKPQAIDIGNLLFCYQMPPQAGTVDDFLHETILGAQ